MGLDPDPARGATAKRRGRLRGAGILSRLLVLVLVPLIVLSLVSTDLALRMADDASSARTTSQYSMRIANELAVLEDVVIEHSVAMVSYETELSGFSVPQASAVLGLNIDKFLHADWATTDRALARISPRLRTKIRPQLSAIRAAVLEGSLSGTGYTKRYGRVESALGAALSSALRTLRATALSAPSTTASGLLALEACDELVEASADEVRDESTVWFAAGADSRRWATRLGADMALLAAAGNRLVQARIPAATKAWHAYATSPSVAVFNRLLTDGAYDMPMPFDNGRLDPASGTVPFSTLIPAYHALPRKARLIREVVDAATNSAGERMAELANHSHLEYELWLIAIVAAGIVFLGGAALIGPTITRPLRRLEDAAYAVVAGELDGEPLPTTGPKEMATVAAAVNSLMENLRLLEAKTQALASLDFDNEALSVPLPGLLGASLQDSVRLLAGSIQDREQLQQRLAFEATHDALTELLNRAAAISQLQQTLDRAARRIETTAVLYIDLDHFKRINDVHGHQVGDHVLREVGSRLHTASRRGEIVARLGGDEFLVVVERVETMEVAMVVGERLLKALSEHFLLDDMRL
ncbi:MAG: diguanylate cyclase domain-containing protein, partial [Acidimicrobiales bacterium]